MLDSEPDERFDRLTRLARMVFGVPLASITMLDRQRAWFRSCAGADLTEVPRTDTFCNRTVQLERLMIVEDAFTTPEFASLPIVAGPPHVRFYAGQPIADDNGVVVATFCLFDTEPRTLSGHELEMFTEMAGWARTELLNSEEMRRARQVQQSLLPAMPPELPGYRTAAICMPARSVGGDFYDFRYEPSAGTLRVTIADVMGKGAGAAIVNATVQAVLRSLPLTDAPAPTVPIAAAPGALSVPSAAMILDQVAPALRWELEQTESLVTLFLAQLDLGSGRLTFADAGHGLSVIASREDARWLPSTDLPLGVDSGFGFTDHREALQPGETLLCLSDGLLDLLGGDADALAQIGAMARRSNDPDILIAEIAGLASLGVATDDVTALAIRRDPAGR